MRSSDEILYVGESGKAFFSNSTSKLVLCRQIGIGELRQLHLAFESELREALCDALSMNAQEFSAWHGGQKYTFGTDVCPPHCCVGFKRGSGNKLALVRLKALLDAMVDAGHIKSSTSQGSRRKMAPRNEGHLADHAQSLLHTEQRQLLRTLITDAKRDLDDVVTFSQASVIGLDGAAAMVQHYRTTDEAIEGIGSALRQFFVEQKTKTGGARGTGRHFAVPWFAAYLAREGVVLWPKGYAPEASVLLPQLLRPLWRTFFTPQQGRDLANQLIGPHQLADLDYVGPVFRKLLLESNFFQGSVPPSDYLMHLKKEAGATSAGTGFIHGLNLVFRKSLAHENKSFEDVQEVAPYFGGGIRLNREHGVDAFSWVDDPVRHKPRLYCQVTGEADVREFPAYLRTWASNLREVLPRFEVKSATSKIGELNHWLVYLAIIGEEQAPKSWETVERERYVKSVSPGNDFTFCDHLIQHGGVRAASILTTVRNAWNLASTMHGFGGRIPCPIAPEDANEFTSGKPRQWRTRRKAISADILSIIVEENRKENFSFARSLGRYQRRVQDPETGREVEVFWPALPIMLDVILSTGMRKASAQYLDSGEGDEFLVEPDDLSLRRNDAPGTLKGRQKGFLRLIRTGPRAEDHVLGMFIATGKTGAHEFPWVDEVTAQNFLIMQNWQTRYNPRKRPIIASRSQLNKKYGDVGQIPEVFAVFRDPDSRQGFPPSDGTLYKYWEDLLRHCEPIVRTRRMDVGSKPERLLVDGKPRWDIHSIRVTVATSLLELGINPHVVQELLGHKALSMTHYYRSVDNAKTHREIVVALEAQRAQLVNALFGEGASAAQSQRREVDLPANVSLRGDDHQGAAMLREVIDAPATAAYEVFSHGICPGGDCKTGGRSYKGNYQPVFRPRACSMCRHRFTGPAFLVGLAHRADSLMIEMKQAEQTEARMRREIERLEALSDEGFPKAVLEANASRMRELRDDLAAEWLGEFLTIKKAEQLATSAGESGSLPMTTGLDASEVGTVFEAVHELTLLHRVIHDQELIIGSCADVPAGALDRRNHMLLEIARTNNIAQYFYVLDPALRRRALDAFGDLLQGDPAGGRPGTGLPAIEALLSGEARLADSPALEAATGRLVSKIRTLKTDRDAVELERL